MRGHNRVMSHWLMEGTVSGIKEACWTDAHRRRRPISSSESHETAAKEIRNLASPPIRTSVQHHRTYTTQTPPRPASAHGSGMAATMRSCKLASRSPSTDSRTSSDCCDPLISHLPDARQKQDAPDGTRRGSRAPAARCGRQSSGSSRARHTSRCCAPPTAYFGQLRPLEPE